MRLTSALPARKPKHARLRVAGLRPRRHGAELDVAEAHRAQRIEMVAVLVEARRRGRAGAQTADQARTARAPAVPQSLATAAPANRGRRARGRARPRDPGARAAAARGVPAPPSLETRSHRLLAVDASSAATRSANAAPKTACWAPSRWMPSTGLVGGHRAGIEEMAAQIGRDFAVGRGETRRLDRGIRELARQGATRFG
jgi:hypothetical protein